MSLAKEFDIIIVGGSYSGLAAGMALGRALKNVLIIDSGQPCNRQTPHSHNFITQDGKTPAEIAMLARKQVENYKTVHFFSGVAVKGEKVERGYEIQTGDGETFRSQKLIFATGIKDIMPAIPGYAECWGISVLHCPYCHGYEVRDVKTGILGNGDYGFEFAQLISNWTRQLTLFTNGPSSLNITQQNRLQQHGIEIIETPVEKLEHMNGYIRNVVLSDGTSHSLKALYARSPFEQHCPIPAELGCEFTEEGYIKVDALQKTSIDGVFACGDNTTRMRAVATAVAAGTTAGMMANKEMVLEAF
jgi:thioredoxin reductase